MTRNHKFCPFSHNVATICFKIKAACLQSDTGGSRLAASPTQRDRTRGRSPQLVITCTAGARKLVKVELAAKPLQVRGTMT